MPVVLIDGVEYVPKASRIERVTVDGRSLDAAVRELVNIQYFAGQTHKHRAWAWDAINHIDPELAQLCSDDPQAAHDAVTGDP